MRNNKTELGPKPQELAINRVPETVHRASPHIRSQQDYLGSKPHELAINRMLETMHGNNSSNLNDMTYATTSKMAWLQAQVQMMHVQITQARDLGPKPMSNKMVGQGIEESRLKHVQMTQVQ